MKKRIMFFTTVFFIWSSLTLNARPWRVDQVPNGSKFSCNTCHTSGGGTPRNDFGLLVQKSFLVDVNGQLNANWGPLLASLDADNDGVTNGEELLDPYGQWAEGTANPGNPDLVTSAGLSNSSPLSALTINFSGMTPHVGQLLYLRVYDKTDMKEVGRTLTTVSASFSLNMDVILTGHNYNIDFFSDHNSNGLYDSAPTDHTWRIKLDNAQGSDVVEFAHNTNFVEIDWPYLLTVNFKGLTPHIGQLLEIRVEDDVTSEEVVRKRIELIPSADFTVELPGIKMGKEYKVEMYADLNKNGTYDTPPSDHAWEIKFENNTGNVITEFTHNTDFKDIGWKYLYTLNLIGMNPHIGQQMFIRVVSKDNGGEVGRKSVVIPGVEFSVSIPQIEMGHDYNVDFFSDHNGNGIYDAPPADHAWRMTFNSTTGNFVENFTHNTNFTDIGWTDITAVEENVFTDLPTEFLLSQNYPNPFNPETKIRFSLPDASFVNVKVYDSIGREVATIVNQNLPSGVHEVPFDASGLQSGVYVYRISANNFNDTKKMMLLK